MKKTILETINRFDTIIIHRHVRPDPDAFGSQCGLAELLKASFPTKKVYTVGSEVESLNFLYRMDIIPDSTYDGSLVIVCDTANKERIDDQRYKLAEMVIKMDHHPNEDPYGDLLWVDTTASSASEMIYEFYLAGKESGLILTKEAARLIFAGIVGDTGRFLFPSTNAKTFTYAGELVNYDFPFTELYENLYTTKQNVSRLSGYVFQNYKISDTGIASVILSREILEKFQVHPSDAAQLVSILGNIEGIVSWAFFVEEADQIRVRLRSKGPIINGIARKYHGGGHPLAAGASIYSWDEVDSVINDLENLSKE